MIIEHKSLELYNQPLFTWIEIETPIEDSLPIPSEACFSYILRGDGQILSRSPYLEAIPRQALLSACGVTLGSHLAHQEVGKLQTLNVHFHPKTLRKIYEERKPLFWEELETPITHVMAKVATSNLIENYVQNVRYLFQNREAVSEDMLVLKLQEIVLLLLQSDDQPKITQIIRSLFSDRSFTFKETIEAYIFTPATVENLASLTNMSLSTFKREFKRVFDDTPQRYLLKKRLEKVAFLLKVSQDSISSIGYDCGFSSPAHLTRSFKAVYNKTPSQYRMDHIGKLLTK